MLFSENFAPDSPPPPLNSESSTPLEFLDIQATKEFGFTLKRVRDMIRTYRQ